MIYFLIGFAFSLRYMVGMYNDPECSGEALVYMKYNLGKVLSSYGGDDVTYDSDSMCYSCDTCPSSAKLSCGSENELSSKYWGDDSDCPTEPSPENYPIENGYEGECTLDTYFQMSSIYTCEEDIFIGKNYAHVQEYPTSDGCSDLYNDIQNDMYYKLDECIIIGGIPFKCTAENDGLELTITFYSGEDCSSDPSGSIIHFDYAGECTVSTFSSDRRFAVGYKLIGFGEEDDYTSNDTNESNQDEDGGEEEGIGHTSHILPLML